MITLKSVEEIKKLREGGQILSQVLKETIKKAKVGVTTKDLDILAEDLIRKAGGIPSFKNYKNTENDPPFPTTLCTSVNEQLVHTPASGRILKSGDILTIDLGMKYAGLYTDMAATVPIGKISQEAKRLIKITKRALELAIKEIKPGNYLFNISRAIQNYVEKNGLAVVRDLVGHGVGYQVHEEPRIPNFVSENQLQIELKQGMVLAIEPMVNLGSNQIKVLDNGWTVVTADGKLCAHFEHTVAVVKDGCLIITE